MLKDERSGFRSQHPQNTKFSGNSWKLKRRKSARRYGARRIAPFFRWSALKKNDFWQNFLPFLCGPLGEMKKSYGINKFFILQMDGLIGKQIQKLFCTPINRLINTSFKKSIGGQNKGKYLNRVLATQKKANGNIDLVVDKWVVRWIINEKKRKPDSWNIYWATSRFTLPPGIHNNKKFIVFYAYIYIQFFLDNIFLFISYCIFCF